MEEAGDGRMSPGRNREELPKMCIFGAGTIFGADANLEMCPEGVVDTT